MNEANLLVEPLPHGWKNHQFGDVCDRVRDSYQPIDDGNSPYVGLEHLAQGFPSFVGRGTESEVKSSKTAFKVGDILFGKLRPYLRKGAQADFDGVCSTDILAFRAKEGCESDFLKFLIHSDEFVTHAISTTSGVQHPRTSWPSLREFCLSLPPLPEQRKIAAILVSVDAAIEKTEALIAIDVNTGRHRGKGSQEEAILEVNLEAVEEVARQLRLRNVGGLVVIDLIDMKSRKHQTAVYKAMKAALKRDKARTNVMPISELGIMELTRQRQEESLLAQSYEDCPYCRGHGVIKSALALSADIQRQIAGVMRKCRKDGREIDLQILVAPTVLDRLRREDEAMLVELQQQYKGHLSFKSEPLRHPESFEILDATGKVLYSVGEHKSA